MGTNFYLKHIPTEKEHQEMQELLMKKQYDDLKKLNESSTVSYHIGKRSCGWQFLFAPHEDTHGNKNPWNNTLQSLKEWLSNPEYVIEDEYGEQFTPEQFWDEEIGPYLYHSKECINGYDYDAEEGHKGYFSASRYEFTTEEGLRFSTDIEFS